MSFNLTKCEDKWGSLNVRTSFYVNGHHFIPTPNGSMKKLYSTLIISHMTIIYFSFSNSQHTLNIPMSQIILQASFSQPHPSDRHRMCTTINIAHLTLQTQECNSHKNIQTPTPMIQIHPPFAHIHDHNGSCMLWLWGCFLV